MIKDQHQKDGRRGCPSLTVPWKHQFNNPARGWKFLFEAPGIQARGFHQPECSTEMRKDSFSKGKWKASLSSCHSCQQNTSSAEKNPFSLKVLSRQKESLSVDSDIRLCRGPHQAAHPGSPRQLACPEFLANVTGVELSLPKPVSVMPGRGDCFFKNARLQGSWRLGEMIQPKKQNTAPGTDLKKWISMNCLTKNST